MSLSGVPMSHVPGGFASGAECECCEPLDPFMDPCCAREISDRRKYGVVMKKLRSLDPVRRAEEMRRYAVGTMPPYEAGETAVFREPQTAVLEPVSLDGDSDSESDDEDWDESDNELMEKLRDARVREIEEQRSPGLRQLSSHDALAAATSASTTVTVLAYDYESVACGHIERVLASIASTRNIVCCRVRAGALLRVAEAARLSSDRLEHGALAVFVRGEVSACAVDMAQFGNDDCAASDAIETWLERARAFDGDGAAAAVLDDEAEEAPEEDFYACGKPGCQRPFEHHHVGLNGAVPTAWDANSTPV
ncbi:hypothetical protein M885DRAFT_619520 [Pelagophyceae sp. CCMP2097]|nr:hypothetical protein M885DRAFT_619520 [Pelagophyceae sp. CCMP2097]